MSAPDRSVTVVVPLHDMRATVDRALRSVAAQTLRPAEVIVVDDGSTDADPRAVEALGLATVISQPHAGPGAARNRGVDVARSRWIAFLDADDEWRPEFLARTIPMTERHPHAVAVFTDLVDDRGRRLISPRGDEPYLVEDYFRLLRETRGVGMSCSSTLVRRDALLRAGGFPVGPRLGEDLDTWARLAWTGPVAFVPEPLALYHGSADAVSRAGERRGHEIPVFFETYATWRDTGRIPPRLAATSRDFARWFAAQYVAALTHDGRKRAAWRVVCAARAARILGAVDFTAGALRVSTPVIVLRALRRLKGRLGA